MKPLIKTLIAGLLAFSASQASALSFEVDYNLTATNGIQKLTVKASHPENTFMTISIRDKKPIKEYGLFKSTTGMDLSNVKLLAEEPVEVPILFTVPQKGYFTYEICGTTSPEPAGEGSPIFVNVRVCDVVEVKNQ